MSLKNGKVIQAKHKDETFWAINTVSKILLI